MVLGRAGCESGMCWESSVLGTRVCKGSCECERVLCQHVCMGTHTCRAQIQAGLPRSVFQGLGIFLPWAICRTEQVGVAGLECPLTLLKLLWRGAGLPGGPDSKQCDCSKGDPGLIPGLGRFPGGGKGTPLQYSCLENPMDRGAWQATVHGVAKSRTRLNY